MKNSPYYEQYDAGTRGNLRVCISCGATYSYWRYGKRVVIGAERKVYGYELVKCRCGIRHNASTWDPYYSYWVSG